MAVLNAAGLRSAQAYLHQLTEAVKDTAPGRVEALARQLLPPRLAGYEAKVNAELRRFGLVGPPRRPGQVWRVNHSGAPFKAQQQAARAQARLILQGDHKAAVAWAARRARGLAREDPAPTKPQLQQQFDFWLKTRTRKRGPVRQRTEALMAGHEALTDLYIETGLADPRAAKYWHFVPRYHDGKSCGVCTVIVRHNPYTYDDLVTALDMLGAMAPEAFVVHPHERHHAEFRPPRQWMRDKARHDELERWALANGHFVNAQAETRPKATPAGPPHLPSAYGELATRGTPVDPGKRKTSVPAPESLATEQRARKVCGAAAAAKPTDRFRKLREEAAEEALEKGTASWRQIIQAALGQLGCETLTAQATGHEGIAAAAALFGHKALRDTGKEIATGKASNFPPQFPFDTFDPVTQTFHEVKARSLTAAQPTPHHITVGSDTQAARDKAHVLAAFGGQGQTITALRYPDDRISLYGRAKLNDFKQARLDSPAVVHMADIDGKTRQVTWYVTKFPWEAERKAELAQLGQKAHTTLDVEAIVAGKKKVPARWQRSETIKEAQAAAAKKARERRATAKAKQEAAAVKKGRRP